MATPTLSASSWTAPSAGSNITIGSDGHADLIRELVDGAVGW